MRNFYDEEDEYLVEDLHIRYSKVHQLKTKPENMVFKLSCVVNKLRRQKNSSNKSDRRHEGVCARLDKAHKDLSICQDKLRAENSCLDF